MNTIYDVNEHREDGVEFTAVYAIFDEFANSINKVEIRFINAWHQDADSYARENSGDGETWTLDTIQE